MVLLKGLAAIASLASIATCSPLDSEASSGALGVASIPAVAPLDHAHEPGNLPHMPADLATGQLAPHSQKSNNHNGQVALEKLGSHNGIGAGHHVQSLAEHQHSALGQKQLLPLTTEEKALAPPSPPKLAIREVIERGIANIGARSDPPAQSFIQALGNMFSGLGKDKGKRDAPPALPAPPGPAPGAMNVSTPPNNPDPAAGVPPLPQGNSPTPPTPALPAPAPLEAAVPPPAPQSGPGDPPPAGLHPPPNDPNSVPADLTAASPPSIGSPPFANPPALPATPADAPAPSAAQAPPAQAPPAQAPPANNADPPPNLSAAPPSVDTGAISSQLDSTAPHDFKPVPPSLGAVAQDGHMGQFDPQSKLLSGQQYPAHRNGANVKWAHSVGSTLGGGPKNFRHRASHHKQHHQGMNHYGANLPLKDYTMPPGAPFDFQASIMVGPPAGPSMTGSGQQLAVRSRYYRNRRNLDFALLPRTQHSSHARNHVYYRRDESSISAGPSDESVEEKTTASEAVADDKPVKSDDTAESTPAVKAETEDSSAEPKPKEKPDTETAEKTVDSKAADKSKDDTAEKAADSKASEKSKATTADEPADDKAGSKSDATETSTKSKAAAKASKDTGSMPVGLDSSFAIGGAEDAAPKKHHNHAAEAHKKGGNSKAKAPAYIPRPKGHRTKSKGKKPSVSDHHSSRYNPHHKMIPQIARRHELRARNAAAEADAWVDAYAKYLSERDVYGEYLAKREAWPCSDPSGCN